MSLKADFFVRYPERNKAPLGQNRFIYTLLSVSCHCSCVELDIFLRKSIHIGQRSSPYHQIWWWILALRNLLFTDSWNLVNRDKPHPTEKISQIASQFLQIIGHIFVSWIFQFILSYKIIKYSLFLRHATVFC